MATPLIWKAYDFNNILFTKPMYPHPLSMNTSTRRFNLETDSRKLVPFYIALFAVFLHLIIPFYTCYEYVTDPLSSLPLWRILFNLNIACMATILLGINIVILRHGEDIFQACFTVLFVVDRKMRKVETVKLASRNYSWRILIPREIKKLVRKDPTVDIVGLIMHEVVATLFITGLTLGPICLFANLDPICYILNKWIPSNGPAAIAFKTVFRILVGNLAVLEATRTFAMVGLPAVSFFHIVMSCLTKIGSMAANKNSIGAYSELRCVCQIGMAGIREVAGVWIALGFLLGVMGTWIFIAGWKILPFTLYAVLTVTTGLIYVETLMILPFICECYKFSEHLLRTVWYRRSWKQWRETASGTHNSFDYRVCRRQVKGQAPISFHYGSAVFDEDTTRNFYKNMIDNAISLVLM